MTASQKGLAFKRLETRRVIPLSDDELIAQLNAQLITANAALEAVRAHNRDLQRKVAELMCWQVGAFADGDLDTERADAFRAHLDGCAKCQTEVLELEQLKARLSALEPTSTLEPTNG